MLTLKRLTTFEHLGSHDDLLLTSRTVFDMISRSIEYVALELLYIIIAQLNNDNIRVNMYLYFSKVFDTLVN